MRDHMKKPLIAYIAGLSAPKGRRMGHAGAIISAFGEVGQEKVEILKARRHHRADAVGNGLHGSERVLAERKAA